MIEIAFSSSFKRAFKRKVAGSKERKDNFWNKIEVFKNNPFESQLKSHKLSGKLKDYWSFSIEFDLRVIFYFAEEEKIVFIDVGTHKEVY